MQKMTRLLAILVGLYAASVGIATAQDPARNFVTHLDGSEEVPPRDTLAQGQAIFHLNSAGTELSYKLIVANIENVFAAHIHLSPVGANGPIVASLFGAAPGGGRTEGVLAQGTITAANLVGPLAGATSLAALIGPMLAGNTYVNVHTNNGVGPINEGPGDFPGGEVRGQIRSAGN